MPANREAALKAVDDAFADGVKHLYTVLLAAALSPQFIPDEAKKRFEFGLSSHVAVHALASATIEAHFGSAS